MSTSAGTRSRPKQTARQILQQRSVDATKELRDAFNLPFALGDATILGTALAEIAAEEGRRNPRFASAVRERYNELVTFQAPAQRASRQTQDELPPLKVVGHLEPGERLVFDPFEPPDPKFLTRVYGRDQLARALQDYTLAMLKETASRLEQRHPGTRPSNRSRKDAVIAYIVEQSGNE